jgi:hypothetical protein
MFMCVVNLKLVNKLDLTWKQSFLILFIKSVPLNILRHWPFILYFVKIGQVLKV